jgi:predicted ATPase/DNA-binding XRE family transcriptional regulator
MTTTDTTFGDLLRTLRTDAGLTQEELAERAGLSARGISDLERAVNRSPYRTTLQRIIDALALDGASADALWAVGNRPRVPRVGRRVNSRAPLPIPPTRLLGREQEEAIILRLLRVEGRRLLTLTGTGGVGKTHLALQVAAAAAPDYADGAAFVSLASITDATLVPDAIAAALNVQAGGATTPEDAVRSFLTGRELLLVLDNFEQVADAAPLIADLLAVCPKLKALATSREPLHVRGEQEVDIGPLDVGENGATTDWEEKLKLPAVRLFAERASAVQPAFELNERTANRAFEICRKLDGIPLAIELAAAQVKYNTPRDLLSQLARPLDVLTAGPRDMPRRQRTMRDTIAWSYNRLSPLEQVVFRHVAVFSGGCTLRALDGVLGAAYSDKTALRLVLNRLIDKSLLLSEKHDETRFRMLETLREFGLEKLRENSEEGGSGLRHAQYYLELARSANLTTEAEGEMRHDLVIRDRDNIRSALEWSRGSGNFVIGLELAVALENYWVTGSPLEGKRWLTELLERAEEIPGELRAGALRGCGNTRIILGEFEEGWRLYEESLAEYRRVGNEAGIGLMLQRLASQERFLLSDPERARALANESLLLLRKIGLKKGEAVSLGILADLELRDGLEESALSLLDQSAALAQRVGFVWWHAGMAFRLAELLLKRQRLPEADFRIRQALPLVVAMEDRQRTIYFLALFAHLAVETGHPERAGRLWGAIEAEEAHGPIGQWEADRNNYAAPVLAHAGSDFERGRREGRRVSLREAVQVVLDADAVRNVI